VVHLLLYLVFDYIEEFMIGRILFKMNLQEIDITTPEHVHLKFKIAGIGSRATAQIIDWFILGLLNFTIFFITLKIDGSFFADYEQFSSYIWAIVIILFFLLTWGYFAFYEFFNSGRTIGKWLMGIRVIQDNGQTITFMSSFVRNLLRIVDFLPGMYLLGILMIFFHSKHKRVGDLVAGTIVIYERKRKKGKKNPFLKEMEKRKIQPERMVLDDWTKKKIGAREWNLLKTYMERRQTLGVLEREKLTLKVAGVLFPLLQVEFEGKPYEAVEMDLLALYMVLREDWEF
jgi:uncharacterized RDD family membrane protein YckC